MLKTYDAVLDFAYDFAWSSGKRKAAALTLATCFTVGAMAFFGAYDPKEPESVDQATLDSIHQARQVLARRTIEECGTTSKDSAIDGYYNMRGAGKAIDVLEQLYTDKQELADVLNFFRANNIILHATNNNTPADGSAVRAVFYNDTDVDFRKVLILQKYYIGAETDYLDAVGTLIEGMRTGDVLEKKGAHVVFLNNIDSAEAFPDIRHLKDRQTLGYEDFVVMEDNPDISYEVTLSEKQTFDNPCWQAPAPTT